MTRNEMYKSLRDNNVAIKYNAKIDEVRIAYDAMMNARPPVKRNDVVTKFASQHKMDAKVVRARMRRKQFNAPYTLDQLNNEYNFK